MSSKEPMFSIEKINELAAKKIAENAEKRGSAQPSTSLRIDLSVELFELITAAESDQSAAMRLLEKAAESLRQGAALHPMLAKHLADAIEVAAAKPPAFQAQALTEELHLSSRNRRPANSWLMVGHEFADLVSDGMSATKAKIEIAVKYGIDEKTALKYYKVHKEAKAIHDSIE